MKKYKVVFIDPNEPYGIGGIIEANSEQEAKDKFHKQWKGCELQYIFELVDTNILR